MKELSNVIETQFTVDPVEHIEAYLRDLLAKAFRRIIKKPETG